MGHPLEYRCFDADGEPVLCRDSQPAAAGWREGDCISPIVEGRKPHTETNSGAGGGNDAVRAASILPGGCGRSDNWPDALESAAVLLAVPCAARRKGNRRSGIDR